MFDLLIGLLRTAFGTLFAMFHVARRSAMNTVRNTVRAWEAGPERCSGEVDAVGISSSCSQSQQVRRLHLFMDAPDCASRGYPNVEGGVSRGF
jgi:hypothetical protein